MSTVDLVQKDRSKVSVTETLDGPGKAVAQCMAACKPLWPTDQGRVQVVTRAPGRLDVMGGMADYSGTLAVQMPVDRGVYVLAGRRDDQRVCVVSQGWDAQTEPVRSEWTLSLLYQSDGQITRADEFRKHFAATPWALHVNGVFLSLLEAGLVPHYAGGVTLVVQSDIPTQAGLASSAAIQVAVAKALAALFEVELSDASLLSACQTANLEVVGAEPGMVDHVTCLLGERDALLQIHCQPGGVVGPISFPEEVKCVAVASGVRLPIFCGRYADNRVSAMLGRMLIDRMLRLAGEPGDPAGGYLANISPNEYVRRFRNELPVKMRGKDFIAQYGWTDDGRMGLDPNRIYKVRSRTEHHIYENARTHRFLERLARTRRTGERGALVEAGELMYASHWSYGQRCGMGSIETDVLVNLIRDRGHDRGLYGAKVTGGGCGGVVAVLMADHDAARAALQEACAEYAVKTGHEATLIAGSSPGAAVFGAQVID